MLPWWPSGCSVFWPLVILVCLVGFSSISTFFYCDDYYVQFFFYYYLILIVYMNFLVFSFISILFLLLYHFLLLGNCLVVFDSLVRIEFQKTFSLSHSCYLSLSPWRFSLFFRARAIFFFLLCATLIMVLLLTSDDFAIFFYLSTSTSCTWFLELKTIFLSSFVFFIPIQL